LVTTENRLRSMRDLFSEYVASNAELMAFFSQPPRAVFAQAPEPAPWPGGLVDALRSYNARLGASVQLTGHEAVIATGQQPGLFTGPLYTIYKATTAIRLAERLEAAFGVPCVPVFWVGADDHDFEEARSAHFLTKTHEPMTLTYSPAEPVDGRSMYQVHLEESLHAFVDEAAARTRGSEYRDEIAAFLHDSLSASASLADWTARLLARLFRDTPLVLFAPHMPVARDLARGVLEREIAEPLASTALLNATGARLQALGFPQQVVKAESACTFFVEMGKHRRRVLFEDGRFHLPEEDTSCSVDDMQALLTAAPERFSPNVALRCVVQQHLFAPTAYVAGPGEVAYWAQLGPLFDRFGCGMPIVYPRARGVLTTLKLRQLQKTLGLTFDDLAADAETATTRALERVTRGPARETIEENRPAVEDALQRLARGLDQHDPNAATMARRLAQHVGDGLDRLERAILRADETHVAATQKQVARVCNALAPFRKAQERVYTVFSFLFEHGWELIPRLLDTLDIESFEINEVEL